MTAENDPVQKAINDARALLDTVLTSGWQEIHVRSGGVEVFIAREGGGPNPMRAAPAPAAPIAAPERAAETVVTAPHVATLEELSPIGARVAAGQVVATLRVLDERIAIEAPVAGTVSRLDAAPGDLLDYKASIVAIVEAS